MPTVSASLSPFMQPLGGVLRRTPLRLVSGVMQDPIVRHEEPLERSPLKLLKRTKKRG